MWTVLNPSMNSHPACNSLPARSAGTWLVYIGLDNVSYISSAAVFEKWLFLCYKSCDMWMYKGVCKKLCKKIPFEVLHLTLYSRRGWLMEGHSWWEVHTYVVCHRLFIFLELSCPTGIQVLFCFESDWCMLTTKSCHYSVDLC
jgi:hypothetical protein